MLRKVDDEVETSALTNSEGVCSGEEERHNALLAENDDLKRQISDKVPVQPALNVYTMLRAGGYNKGLEQTVGSQGSFATGGNCYRAF